MKKDKLALRIAMSIAGVLICSVSVAIFKTAAFGVDPFQSFMSGASKLIFRIDFGTLYIIVNAALLLFSVIHDKHYIGIATFVNLFLLGYVTDFSYKLIGRVLPDPSYPVRIACLIAGIVIICIGSSLYMTADLGVSTYDAVALILANTYKIWKFKYIRIVTDIICVLSGAALFIFGDGKLKDIPAFIGIGTIITAFFMGPLIEFFNEKIARPLLKKQDNKD